MVNNKIDIYEQLIISYGQLTYFKQIIWDQRYGQ
jgi:hypothetical protein